MTPLHNRLPGLQWTVLNLTSAQVPVVLQNTVWMIILYIAEPSGHQKETAYLLGGCTGRPLKEGGVVRADGCGISGNVFWLTRILK